MARLDHGWLHQSLASCKVVLPGVSGAPSLTAPLSDDDLSVLSAYYGATGLRCQRAREAYGLVKACAFYLASGLEFSSIWRSVISTEWLASLRLEDHMEGKLYRDHIFHPAAVAMLGRELLQHFPLLHKRAVARLVADLGTAYHLDPGDPKQTWEAVLDQAWLVAGFFHDHCCPLETTAKFAEGLSVPSGLALPDQLALLRGRVRTLCRTRYSDAKTRRLLDREFGGVAHSHAPLSALSLHSLRSSARNDFARAVLDAAIDAVLWHHATGKAYHWQRAGHFAFEAYPLRFLLVLCDGLHEFCRELLHREDCGNGEFHLSFRGSCTRADLEVTGGQVTIAYHVNCDPSGPACETRWELPLFGKGLRRLERFAGRCGPLLDLQCRIVHGDCRTCPAGGCLPCKCEKGMCNHR